MSRESIAEALVTLAEVIEGEGVFVDGDWVESKDQDPDGDVRLVQLADVGDGEYRDRSSRFLTSAKAKELRCTFLERGDILVARMPDPLGRACIFPGDARPSVTVVDVAVVRPRSEQINNRWLMYRLNAPEFRRAVAGLQSGSTRQRISRKNLAAIPFRLPPRKRQDDAVAEIEKQFSRLDEAVANLQRVRANLKRYKAAVLKAAVEGRLVATEAELSRVDGHQFESGEELVARIARSAGVSRGGAQSNVPPPVNADEDFAEVPEGWALARSGDLLSFVTSGSRGWAKYYADTGSVFIRVGNLDHDTIDLDLNDTQRVQVPPGLEAQRSRAKPGDLVISITAELGMVAVIPRAFEDAYVNQHVAIARPVPLVDSSYLGWYFACKDAGKGQLEALRRGATKAGLGLDDIRAVVVALPPLAEQNRIVAEVDRRLSIAREVEIEVDVNLKRAQALRQAVLAKAFASPNS